MADHTSNAADIMDEIDKVLGTFTPKDLPTVQESVSEMGALGGECIDTLSAIIGILTAEGADTCPLCLEVLDIIKQGTVKMTQTRGRLARSS